jgi:hypothetical protein
MTHQIEPVDERAWVKGDYRYGASISAEGVTIDGLATSVGAHPQSFVEDGLGPGKSFGVRLPTGRQVAFEQFENGAAQVSLMVLFEHGTCSMADIWKAVELFNIPKEAVTWVAPEAK